MDKLEKLNSNLQSILDDLQKVIDKHNKRDIDSFVAYHTGAAVASILASKSDILEMQKIVEENMKGVV